MSAIKEYENNKWKVIGQKVGKPAKVDFLSPPPALFRRKGKKLEFVKYNEANQFSQACEQYAKEHFPGMKI